MGYSRKFFERHATEYRGWEKAIGVSLVRRFGITSAVDFGCGVGSYLEGMQDAGVNRLRGFEWAYDNSMVHTPKEILWCIEKRDVTVPLSVGSYDLSLSIEVAEHLPPEGTDQFLNNLTSASHRLIVFSAAPPGQRGTHHINCRPKTFWLSETEKRGFRFLENETNSCIKEWKSFGTAAWVLKNVMIFQRIE